MVHIHPQSKFLVNLAADFNLSEDNNKIYFDAFVEFLYDGKQVNINSKVVIVSTEQGTPHDMLFLLNTKLIAMHFPEAFRSDKDSFTYDGRSLMITGTDRYVKKYVVIIHPVAQG